MESDNVVMVCASIARVSNFSRANHQAIVELHLATRLTASAVLRAAELHSDARLTDDSWAVLAAHFDEGRLVEVLMLVGQYHIVSFTLNTLAIQASGA